MNPALHYSDGVEGEPPPTTPNQSGEQKQETRQSIPTGTKGTFSGYADEDVEGPLTGNVGIELEVTGFDDEDSTYNVKATIDDEEVEDSLYDDEFEVVEAGGTKGKAKKKTAKKAAKKATKKTAAKKAATKAPAQGQKAKATKTAAKKTAAKKATKKTAKKAAKKTAKVKKTEEVKELPAFKKTTTVASTLKEYDGDACAAAYDWAEEAEKTNFVLGGLLAYIKRNDEHTKVEDAEYPKGLKGFNEFVMDYLNVNKVRAHWLVRIYETFSQLGVTEKQIETVGWTKARELLPLGDLLTEKNVDEWLEKAGAGTTDELHEEVKKKLVKSGAKTHGNKKTNEQVNRKFVFFDHQAEVVDGIIARKKEELDDATKGDYPDSAALYAILTEYADLTDQEGE